MLCSSLNRFVLAFSLVALAPKLNGGCMQEVNEVPMCPDARQEFQFVRGMFLYAAIGNQGVKGDFPRFVSGDLGPLDLDGLMHILYAENGDHAVQRNLAFGLKQDADKQNPWVTLRARYWLTQCGDEATAKDLEKAVPNLFGRRVDLAKGMASVDWSKAELEGVRKLAQDALLGNAGSAWNLHEIFSRKGAEDLMECSRQGWLSVMDLVALLRRAPTGISREEMNVFWLLIAAENGHVEAQYEIGSHYFIPDNFGIARALFWLEKATKGGSEKAKKRIEFLQETNQSQGVRAIVHDWKKTLGSQQKK